MSRVLALVEGQTEQAFVREVLAPELGARGVFISAALVGKPGHKGGVRSYQSVRKDILASLKQDSGRFCTTMFDYYGLPADWPGVPEAKSLAPRAGVSQIESVLLDDICAQMGGTLHPPRFQPYIQLHEFEALLFCDPETLASVLGSPSLGARLGAVVEPFSDPEMIDDDPKTAPSKRIALLAANYQKSSPWHHRGTAHRTHEDARCANR